MSEQLTTTIDLIRHGEVEGGACYRGQQDDPLSEAGWQQMHQALDGEQSWDIIITSPLSRCRDFASKLSQQLELNMEENTQLTEIAFGEWEGKTAAQLLQQDRLAIESYWNNPLSVTPPGGESLPDFQQRVIAAWQQVLQHHQGKHVLMISHAGVMRIILANILAMPLTHLFNLQVGYAATSRIMIDHFTQQQSARLVFHNGEA